MINRTYILAVVTCFVLTVLIAGTWHLFLFKDLYDRLAIYSRAEPIMPLGLLSVGLQAVILAYLFPIYAAGKEAVGAGLAFGLMIGVLIASCGVFAEAGKQTVTSLPTFLALESVFYLALYGVIGVALGLIHRARR